MFVFQELKDSFLMQKPDHSVHQVRVMEKQIKKVESGVSLEIRNCSEAETAHVDLFADR